MVHFTPSKYTFKYLHTYEHTNMQLETTFYNLLTAASVSKFVPTTMMKIVVVKLRKSCSIFLWYNKPISICSISQEVLTKCACLRFHCTNLICFSSVASEKGGGHLDEAKTRIIVNSSGHHQWYTPINFESHCKIDVRNFPFDQQACVVKLGSWTYDGTRLDIIQEAASADLGKSRLTFRNDKSVTSPVAWKP